MDQKEIITTMKKLFKEIIVTDNHQEVYLTLVLDHQLSPYFSIFMDLNSGNVKEIKLLEEDLRRRIQEKYDELQLKYEASDEYAGKKRDDCHQKNLEIAFPEKDTVLHVSITMQGYIDNEGTKTIFDGGLTMPGLYTLTRMDPVYINLDDYSEQDMEKIQEELEKVIQGCYDDLLSIYESSDEYEGHVKNGTYKRDVKIAFPEEGKAIKITITIQRHKEKSGKTRSFFGGLIVPGYSLLTCQAILLLAARSVYEEDRAMDAQALRRIAPLNCGELCHEIQPS